jgi:hypothetical protein
MILQISKELINELFEYRDGKLFGKTDRGFNKTKGKEVGSVSSDGHMVVCIKYKRYYVHRLIWIMHNGAIPGDMEIDHKDGNPLNNHIENLRIANKSQNGCNRGKNKNNKSGFKGVMFYKAYNKWTAQIKINRKGKSLGYFDTPEEASIAYQNAAKLYHGEFSKV